MSATTTDNDAAGFTIVESGGSTSVSRSWNHRHLHHRSECTTSIRCCLSTVTSSDTGEATVTRTLDLHSRELELSTNGDRHRRKRQSSLTDTNTSTITVAVDDAKSDDDFDGVARPNRVRNHNRQRRSRLHHCSIRWVNQRGLKPEPPTPSPSS
ncbi:MAG: hypothetical protein ACJZ2F_02140 [Acidimicrobiales bacterium]